MKSLSIGLACASSTLILSAETTELLESTTITAQSPDLISGLDKAIELSKTIPGSASVITPEQWTGRTIKPAEIFQFNPSVYAQSSGTGNDTRLSVRGSGIQRRYGSRGITLLQDGIPANHADGSFYTRVIDPLSLDHIEVKPGANGLIYGANQLGGSINFVQKNGINVEGTSLTAEYGSFETMRAALQYGLQQGHWDFFAGYSYAESDGYRDHQEWHTHHFTANAGYHWSDSASTRFYFLFNDSDAKLPGALTEAEFDDDPTQRQPGRDDRTDRDLSTIRLAQRTAWDLTNAQYAFYTYYQYLDFDHLTGIGIGQYNNLIDYDTDEIGLGFTGSNQWRALSLEHTLRSTISYDYGRNEVGGYSGFVPSPAVTPKPNDREDKAENFKIYLENDTAFGAGNHLYLGAGWVNTQRNRQVAPDNGNQSDFTENQDGAVWRIGYLKDFTPNIQAYANISQSFEAAPFSEGANDVSPQKAQTLEIGSRFQHAWITGQISAYLSQVDDEFVDVELAPGSGRYTTTNEDTQHNGIEAYLDINLTEAFGATSAYTLNLMQSYQLNDFTFESGAYDGNQMPGVSKHVYAGKLKLTAPNNTWSAAIAADWLPDGLVADNANTLHTDGFVFWRIAADYKVSERLTLYGGIDNLFDESYASSVTINPSVPFMGDVSYINPADGRAAYLGARVTW